MQLLTSVIAGTALEVVLAFVPPAEIGTAHTGAIPWLTQSVLGKN